MPPPDRRPRAGLREPGSSQTPSAPTAEKPTHPALDDELALDLGNPAHPARIDQLAGGESDHEAIREEEPLADRDPPASGPAASFGRCGVRRDHLAHQLVTGGSDAGAPYLGTEATGGSAAGVICATLVSSAGAASSAARA